MVSKKADAHLSVLVLLIVVDVVDSFFVLSKSPVIHQNLPFLLSLSLALSPFTSVVLFFFFFFFVFCVFMLSFDNCESSWQITGIATNSRSTGNALKICFFADNSIVILLFRAACRPIRNLSHRTSTRRKLSIAHLRRRLSQRLAMLGIHRRLTNWISWNLRERISPNHLEWRVRTRHIHTKLRQEHLCRNWSTRRLRNDRSLLKSVIGPFNRQRRNPLAIWHVHVRIRPRKRSLTCLPIGWISANGRTNGVEWPNKTKTTESTSRIDKS